MSGEPRSLLLFTKPARPGRVKTRLIGDLSPEQAADLHAAFVADLLDRLRGGRFALTIAWALDGSEGFEGEDRLPDPFGLPGVRQAGADLGARLFAALSSAAREAETVMALGSDHPTLPVARVEEAFARVEAGADVVIGPAEDGGYYLIALAARAVRQRLFEGVAWSTDSVLRTTVERCAELGLSLELLPEASDVDTPADLARLAEAMAESDLGCPRTRALLASWQRLPARLATETRA
ncbi:MAG TPA: TIGR04282 family arsenosugar biosynthesis glycosyltransferase [Thermoanaerobaculia bacterium]|nr:TIGR04282 family arsenosugar biosynthesis glycosyltransferase [Thermoanaerobaculia bacterium]